uniref:CIA30 domain-containing protein n=1 Tax=Haemonchus contortus TaxID=6289 RepID=A0A7I4YF54_HAECO
RVHNSFSVMGIRFLTTILLSHIVGIASYTLLDQYYERLTRDNPQTSFNPLNQAQLIEEDTSEFTDETPGKSIGFMVAPGNFTGIFNLEDNDTRRGYDFRLGVNMKDETIRKRSSIVRSSKQRK